VAIPALTKYATAGPIAVTSITTARGRRRARQVEPADD
jgi:hypothetical protein